ncbi:sulfate/molybdate ABC transporter ATP-binding protein [Phenylobacterium sp.]|jgi:sulfate transport system ATP-binding protein|uniref:sulfate/molybdate ABC transporter ATP-binding protein n=1 Tax=Phenylobacterium sp. TaxID=1871053 RepID=UPI002E379D9A|nr:sulfate/molybdate ABC transporter ATP-binding protein [Phenylobacterium sp.]HEX2558994.1 sulfate/molybdate ABC transporter ATP-binding protein [Phenylobacterium sp.]
MSLSIKSVAKAFGRYPALRDVSLEARQGEFLALLGPSGSGKTTLLRILAGLEQADGGEVSFQGENFLSLPARERRVGMVFQHYALFRHMTVARNVAFGLSVRPRSQRPPKAEIDKRVADLLRLVQLDGLADRYPAQLSGGQRQRVALARALAIEPRMLLLDEPFGALDAKVRRELRHWLRRIHDETGVTTVFVTHDQEEALDLADRVAILSEGELVQVGPPQEVYERPRSAFIFDFLGASCRLPGEVDGGKLRVEGWEAPAPEGAPQGRVDVFFRPHEVSLLPPNESGVSATVRNIFAAGPVTRVECAVGDERLEIHGSAQSLPEGLAAGQPVKLKLVRPSLYPAA